MRKLQVILAFVSAFLIWWWNFRNVPFLSSWVNCTWSPMWLGTTYTTGIMLALVFKREDDDPDLADRMTWVGWVCGRPSAASECVCVACSVMWGSRG